MVAETDSRRMAVSAGAEATDATRVRGAASYSACACDARPAARVRSAAAPSTDAVREDWSSLTGSGTAGVAAAAVPLLPAAHPSVAAADVSAALLQRRMPARKALFALVNVRCGWPPGSSSSLPLDARPVEMLGYCRMAAARV